MASVSFRIKGKANPGLIRLRFKQGESFDFEVSTGLKVDLHHWSYSKQKVKNINAASYAPIINNELNNLKTFIEHSYYIAKSKGTIISTNWLKNQIASYFNRSIGTDNNYLTSFIETFIEHSKSRINRTTGRPISPKTINWYRITKRKIEAFEKHLGTRIKLDAIDLNFHQKFIDFLSINQKLNPNTVGAYLGRIKIFLNEAEKRGITVDKSFRHRDFYKPFNKTTNIYLNEEEIYKIYNLDLSKNERLDNVRDWFIIGLWTGLRVSDFFRLTSKNIRDNLIEIIARKTDIPVVIPIHPQIKNTLNKYNGQFPRKISEQKFNKYIKEVCEIAEINELIKGSKLVELISNKKKIFRKKVDLYPKFELVSSHTCRRSFATNHYGKIDTLTIMNITGHKTEKQFLQYIKITPQEHALKLKEFWDKQEINSSSNLIL